MGEEAQRRRAGAQGGYHHRAGRRARGHVHARGVVRPRLRRVLEERRHQQDGARVHVLAVHPRAPQERRGEDRCVRLALGEQVVVHAQERRVHAQGPYGLPRVPVGRRRDRGLEGHQGGRRPDHARRVEGHGGRAELRSGER